MDASKGSLIGIGGGFRFVDLFSGIGGFRLALERLGGRCVMSSEIERRARETYFANFGEWPLGDVRAIRGDDVPEHDVLCGGFPCQTFSICGKKMGFADETRGTLFFEIARILKATKPAVAFLENVRHLVNHDGGRTFGVIRRTLEDCGYIVSSRIINASFFGAPTSRKRLYIVCFRADLGVTDFRFPEPTFEQVALHDVLLPDPETDRWVVRNHPITIDEDAIACSSGKAVLRPIRVGYVGGHKPARQGYRVYASWGHAVTFLARGGGIGAKTGLYLVNGRVRRLDPRECLRVMGFPDSFVIPPSVPPDQVRTLTGNSVVVPVIHSIAACILETLRSTVDSSASAGASSHLMAEAVPHASM